jgi:hypothetical protein
MIFFRKESLNCIFALSSLKGYEIESQKLRFSKILKSCSVSLKLPLPVNLIEKKFKRLFKKRVISKTFCSPRWLGINKVAFVNSSPGHPLEGCRSLN